MSPCRTRNRTHSRAPRLTPLAVLVAAALWAEPLAAQDPPNKGEEAKTADIQVRVTPTELTLAVGQKAQLEASLVDVGGRPEEGRVLFFSRARRSVRVGIDGEVQALQPGRFEIVARAMVGNLRGPQATVVVTVPEPIPAKISLAGAPARLHVGTTVRVVGAVLDKNDIARTDLEVSLRTSDASLVGLDAFGHLTARAPGRVMLGASGGGLQYEHAIEVRRQPGRFDVDHGQYRCGPHRGCGAVRAAAA